MKVFDYVQTLKKFSNFSDIIRYNSIKYPKKYSLRMKRLKLIIINLTV